jgi:hypothetical protein
MCKVTQKNGDNKAKGMDRTKNKKKLLVVTTGNLFNLKSNTMKNTMQSYDIFYVVQHISATFFRELTSFNYTT